MKYELDELDIKNLIVIIDKTTITGNMAETIVALKQKLGKPANECECKKADA